MSLGLHINGCIVLFHFEDLSLFNEVMQIFHEELISLIILLRVLGRNLFQHLGPVLERSGSSTKLILEGFSWHQSLSLLKLALLVP